MGLILNDPWRAVYKLDLLLDQQPLLHLFLTFDAVGRPWDRVEPFRLNVLAAVYALAVLSLSDSIQCFFDQPERVAFISALREKKLFSV